MAGFTRRFTSIPTTETIREIEGLVIVDIAPPEPSTGAGSGAVLCVGEFEDGLFATDTEAKGSVEVFGSSDLLTKFGGFGYTYDNVVANNPSARRHLGEDWNGNGYLKLFKLKASRLMIARVDTSVGEVAFTPLVSLTGDDAGPFALTNNDTLDVTTDGGSASSTAITGAVATVAGSGATFATVSGGDTFGIRIDGGVQTNVVLASSDTTQGAVVTRINSALGYTAAVANLTEIDISGIQAGSGGSVELIEVTSGVLAKLGHSAGTTAGTGNVVDLSAVTATEIAAIVNGTAGLTALDISASVTGDGFLRITNSDTGTTATLQIDSTGAVGAAAGLTVDTAVAVTDHAGGFIPAGTRVRNGSFEFVTMQTLQVEAGETGPFLLKVRHANDDGSGLTQLAGTVTTLVDEPSFSAFEVTNPSDLSAALNEVQLDNRYIEALNATLNDQGAAYEANYLLSARRSDTVVRSGRANAIKATECGLYARKFLTGDPLGASVNDAIANVAKYRSDRVFYTTLGLKVRIPAIAERGTAGGTGFTSDGVITVRADGPLATVCATLAPELNPGQQTGLIDSFFEVVNPPGETIEIEAYKAFRRNGILAPRIDRTTGLVFQSGVTSSLESGRKTAARRKMADFIQDSLQVLIAPYIKLANTQLRRDKIRQIVESFLGGLQAPGNPQLQRIEGFLVDDSENAGNTDEQRALGIHRVAITVRTLASLDNIVLQTEIGENAIITAS